MDPPIEITRRPVSSRKLFNIKSHQSFPPVSTLRHFAFFNNAPRREGGGIEGEENGATPCLHLHDVINRDLSMRRV